MKNEARSRFVQERYKNLGGNSFYRSVEHIATEKRHLKRKWKSQRMFQAAGFEWALGSLPRAERITWPAADGFPDATFDHVLVKGIKVRAVVVPEGYDRCSDHRPVVVDLEG